MSRYRNLYRRIAYLESLLYEGKQDQELLLQHLGPELYKKYTDIRNKITDPEYKDFYKVIKMPVEDIEAYIDSFQSNADLRREAKKGSKLIYDKNGWKVYRITTYEAAVYYGKNTKWCITGNYDGYEEYGRSYFNDYIEDYNLDGGYYFYIKNNNEKYCLLREEDGAISSIWDAKDNQMTIADVIAEVPDFPSIPGVCEINNLPIVDCLFSGSRKLITQAAERGADLNKKYKEYDEYPLTYYVMNDDLPSVITLLQLGADPNILHGEPLRMAISNKEPTMVNALLHHGASVDNKITYDPNELTLVLKAILFETPACLDLLLQAGADPNHFDHKMKEYPMQRALSLSDDKSRAIISLLLEAGADISTAYGGKYFNDKEVDDRLEHLGFI